MSIIIVTGRQHSIAEMALYVSAIKEGNGSGPFLESVKIIPSNELIAYCGPVETED